MSTNGAPSEKVTPTTAVSSSSQPKACYDLLLPRSKSPSFVVLFHMESPQYRFVIMHRAVHQRFSDLDEETRTELIRVAAMLTKDFELTDTTLAIPYGKANLAPHRDHTFYAFLEVPCHIAFSKAFRALLSELPFNTDERWRNHLWPAAKPFEPVTDSYLRALTELPPSKIPCQPSSTDRFATFNFARQAKKSKDPPIDHRALKVIQHCSLPLLGVAGPQRKVNWSLEDRVAVLNKMESFLCQHGQKKVPSYLCISITGVYKFRSRSKRHPIAYIHFPKGIPEPLLDCVVRAPSQNHHQNGVPDAPTDESIQEEKDNQNILSDSEETKLPLHLPQAFSCFPFKKVQN